ncbi:MAG TPA: AI-2E family transporter [Gaiellaceae bacterium]|nr:AI-2E family transporter [Gaiellaceae bacterium]
MAGYAGSEPDDAATPSRPAAPDRDPVRLAAKVAVVVLAVGGVAFGLWQVRSVVILLLLALTLAAAIRPGVEWLQRHRFPQPAAILSFFLAVGTIIVLFFWAAVPPALHQIEQALHKHAGGASVRESTGLRHDVLVWVDRYLHRLPSGHDVLHPVAAYGHQATHVVVMTFFTLAATWYWVAERDRMIDLLTSLSSGPKREKARQTYLAIDARLGAYTRLKFVMIFAVGAALSLGFYLVGLKYWLLAGGFVSVVEIVPVIGPLIGGIFVVAVGLPQSLHVAVLALLVLVAVREFQSYVVNPHIMGHSVGLSPLVTLVSVAVVSILFGGFAVILAVPFTSAVATLIDVFVLDHDAPAEQPGPKRRFGFGRPPRELPAADQR